MWMVLRVRPQKPKSCATRYRSSVLKTISVEQRVKVLTIIIAYLLMIFNTIYLQCVAKVHGKTILLPLRMSTGIQIKLNSLQTFFLKSKIFIKNKIINIGFHSKNFDIMFRVKKFCHKCEDKDLP